jgi:hypothetical protein
LASAGVDNRTLDIGARCEAQRVRLGPYVAANRPAEGDKALTSRRRADGEQERRRVRGIVVHGLVGRAQRCKVAPRAAPSG